MIILFFTRLYYPHIGGVEKHVSEISKILIKKGYKIIIVTEQVSDAKSHEVIGGVEVYRIPIKHNNWFKKFDIWLWLFTHRSLINRSNVVHCHDVFFWYLPFRFLYLFKKVFITFHGYESFPISKKAVFVRKLSEKLSHGNICIGDFVAKWYGTKPTYVSYGGVEVPKFEKKYTNKNSALFYGRLDVHTGILSYVEAVKIVKEKIPTFNFIVYGNGEFENTIDKTIVQVSVFKENPEKELLQYHFAFLSRYLSILEAFAAKRLVFAVYDNPVKKDYLQMAPYAKWMIVENSAEKLAEKILFYLENPQEEKELVEKAYVWVKVQTWDKVTDTYLALWKAN